MNQTYFRSHDLLIFPLRVFSIKRAEAKWYRPTAWHSFLSAAITQPEQNWSHSAHIERITWIGFLSVEYSADRQGIKSNFVAAWRCPNSALDLAKQLYFVSRVYFSVQCRRPSSSLRALVWIALTQGAGSCTMTGDHRDLPWTGMAVVLRGGKFCNFAAPWFSNDHLLLSWSRDINLFPAIRGRN